MKTMRQHGLNLAEKFGIVSVVLTGGIILVNYTFGLHLSQYLRQIPLIGQLINIELIEEFEDIQDGDPFYEELKSQLALLNISEENIQSIQVRKDSAGQETFKIITKDGEEQNIVVKKDIEDGAEDSYQILKQVDESYYRDSGGSSLVEDKKREIFVEVKEREIYIEIPYTGDIPECPIPELISDVSNDSVVCEVCDVCETCEVSGNSELPVDDRYNEGYELGYDEGLVSCSATVDPNYDATAAAALCQKSMDIEYQKGYDEGYGIGYDNGDSVGYQRGFSDGSQEATDTAYQDGYSEGYTDGAASVTTTTEPTYDDGYTAGHIVGYDEGYSIGYQEGYDSCFTSPTTGP